MADPSAGRWRKPVHVAFGAAALLLRWLPFSGVLVLALAAVGFNAFCIPRLPRLARILYRADAYAAPGAAFGRAPARLGDGIFWYPVGVLAAVLLFPAPVAAAGWGFLAVGDGAAALVGPRLATPHWPWNARKTLGGSAALLVCGTVAAFLLFLFVRINGSASPPWWRGATLTAACAAAPVSAVGARVAAAGVLAAAVESLPLRRVDDNLTVPLLTGTFLLASFMV